MTVLVEGDAVVASDSRAPERRFGFIMEQTLGHVTHYRNLRSAVEAEPDVAASWYPVTFEPHGWIERLPGVRSNWSVRASLQARNKLARVGTDHQHDALFFHTQVVTLLSGTLMRRIPSVISLDATPLNYDSVGSAYGHRRGAAWLERAKRMLNVSSLRSAGGIVTWCEWARQSLITDYGLDGGLITVIPPGVNLDLWPQRVPRSEDGVVRILFVGGDFERKGGRVLLDAVQETNGAYELHLVTKAQVDARPGVRVYHDVAPNSELLRQLYSQADVFVLPTLADCFPLVIQEAMAAGLPVIATAVGAVAEAVCDGETGMVVPTNDAAALRRAIDLLASAPERRSEMGRAGRAIAERRFNSTTNAKQILSILHCLVDRGAVRSTA